MTHMTQEQKEETAQQKFGRPYDELVGREHDYHPNRANNSFITGLINHVNNKRRMKLQRRRSCVRRAAARVIARSLLFPFKLLLDIVYLYAGHSDGMGASGGPSDEVVRKRVTDHCHRERCIPFGLQTSCCSAVDGI